MTTKAYISGLLAAATLAALPTAASAGSQLWWSNYSAGAGIPRLDLGSGVGSAVFTGSPAVSGPYGTAADPANGKIYWINYTNRRIYAGNLDGSPTPQPILTSGITGPIGLAADPTRGQLFWAEAGAKKIFRVNMDGSGGAFELFADGVVTTNPVVDPGFGLVYWTRNSTPRSIGYGSVNGGTIGTITVPAGCPFYASSSLETFAVDSENGVVYMGTGGHPITQADTGIAKMDLDGTNCTTVAATSQTPFGFALDPDAKRLYWADSFNNEIRYVSLDPPGTQQTLPAGGAAVSDPVYPVLIKSPSGTATASPASAEPGGTLSCSATWREGVVGASMFRAPQTSGFSWKRDGQAIPGASGSTLVADKAGSYECVATGTNAAGSTAVTSAPVTVTSSPGPPIPPLPPLPPIPTPPNTFTVSAAGSNGSSLRTRVTVPGPGRLSQRGRREVRAVGASTSSACNGSSEIAAAGTYTITCRTSAATRRAQRRGKVRIVLTTSFTPTGGTTASSSRVVTLPALKPLYTG